MQGPCLTSLKNTFSLLGMSRKMFQGDLNHAHGGNPFAPILSSKKHKDSIIFGIFLDSLGTGVKAESEPGEKGSNLAPTN
jgi:hypothetical protein